MENRAEYRDRGWLVYIIMALLAEKIIQHVFVTAAFYFDWNNIGSTVAISPMLLMVLGGLVAILFAVALWAMIRGRGWAANLIIGLALFDVVGEFVAQGTLAIDINVSFIVAIALLVLVLLHRRQVPRPA